MDDRSLVFRKVFRKIYKDRGDTICYTQEWIDGTI